MFESDLFHWQNVVFIVLVSIVAISVFNVMARKFNLFSPARPVQAVVSQYPN